MSDMRWKAFERRIAALLGGRRIPVTGQRAGADIEAGLFVVQAKARGTTRPPPQDLTEWLTGIREAAVLRAAGQVGVVVWQAGKGAPDLHALVVLRLDDWIALHGPVGGTRTEPLT